MCKCGSPSTCQVPGLSPLLSPAVPAGAGAEESRGTPLLSGPEGVFSEGIWFLERFRSERRPPHCPHGLCLSFPELPVVYTVCEKGPVKAGIKSLKCFSTCLFVLLLPA